MGSALLAGRRPDSLVRGDLCLGKFGKQSVSENLSYEGVWGLGGFRAQASRSIAVAVLDVTLARDTPELIHPWLTRLRSWILGLTVADVDDVLGALRWGAVGVARRQLSRQGAVWD